VPWFLRRVALSVMPVVIQNANNSTKVFSEMIKEKNEQ